MKKYLWIRFFKSILSIIIVVSIVVAMVYTMIPTTKVFEQDTAWKKLKTNYKTVYQYGKLEQLGYLRYNTMAEMCSAKSSDTSACSKIGSDEQKRVLKAYEDEGYTVEELSQYDEYQGQFISYKYYNIPQLIGNFFKKLIVIDHPNKIKDAKNPNLERGYSIQKGPNGIPALTCSGCNYKYQFYLGGGFPWIHQNFINLDFGLSYPTQSGIATLDVIGLGQGKMVNKEQTFPTGEKLKSPIIQFSCKYKSELDHLDKKRYTDNYANCSNAYDSPSMINTSYIFGISSLILTYAIALPFGIAMARNKGKLIDKIGIVYINLLIAVPSLAFIFFMKFLGYGVGLPDMFPHLGFFNWKSYVLPILILGLMSTPSLMMWIRRYMVDQSSADYVKFARAKGLSTKEISKKHIFKNAIIPIVNGIPSSIILAISGAVITESVFAIPGMGKMLPDSIKGLNINMVITLTFIFTTLSVFSVFLGDLLMTKVDPRISLNVKEGD